MSYSLTLTREFETLEAAQAWLKSLSHDSDADTVAVTKPESEPPKKRGRKKKTDETPPEPKKAETPDRPHLDTEIRERIKRLLDEKRTEVFKRVFNHFGVKKYVEIPEDKRLELEARLIAEETTLYPEGDEDPLA